MKTQHDIEQLDRFLGDVFKGMDGASRQMVALVVMSNGGKLDITADKLLDIKEGNIRMRINRTELGWEIVAKPRPRCETCGRWEPSE